MAVDRADEAVALSTVADWFPAATVERCPDEGAWLVSRDQVLGASEVATILGYPRFRNQSALAVWAAKTGRQRPDRIESDAVYLGKAAEPVIAGLYQRVTRRRLVAPGSTTLWRSRQWPHLGATLDSLILDAEGRSVPVPLELKWVSWGQGEWRHEPPIAYQMQVQAQMAVTGVDWAGLAALMDGHLVPIDIDRHQAFIERMVEATARWWHDYVVLDVPPPASSPDRKLLEDLYPETGGTVDLPAEVAAWDHELVQLKREIAERESRQAVLENRLRALIGEATVGIIPGIGIGYTLKTQPRKEYVAPATSFRVLRRVSID
jgi:predicted phage-related endonuclease